MYSPSTVGVSNAVLGDLVDGELLDLNFTIGLDRSRDGGQGSLGDNSNPWAAGVLLGQLSQLLGDFDDIVGTPAVALGVGTSLSFVAESVVRVGQNSVELFLEELRNERSGEGKHEDLYLVNMISIAQKNLDQKTRNTYLVLRCGLFSEGQDSGNGDRQVVTTNVVNLGLLNQRPDVRLLQVLGLVLVSRSKVSAHAAVVAGDDDTALAGGLDIVDTVFRVNTSLVTGLLKRVGILVLADAANVNDRVIGEHVLISSARNQHPFILFILELGQQ